MYLKNTVKYFVVLGVMLIPGIILNSEENQNKIEIIYSKLELKAIRYEMIEQDVYVRTIASMISLNNPERLKYWFEKLSESSVSNSKDYKSSVAAVYRKWKKNSVEMYLDNVRKESKEIAKYIEKYEKEKYEGMDWSVVSNSYTAVLENCRGCHLSLAVKIP